MRSLTEFFFDSETELWLVTGTLHGGEEGGVAYLIVQKADGKVLAVWHEK